MVKLEEQLSAVALPSGDSQVEEFQLRIAELTAAVEARDTFIAVAAHELRNPMTPIIGQIELLLLDVRAGRCLPDQVEFKLGRLQRVMRRYMKRAGMLLDVSRITSGKLQLELEPCDLATVLHDVAGEFTEEARRADVSVTVAVPERLPGTWDLLAVEQIVDNLLSNALKHGARTPVELSAKVQGEQVRIQVRDGGPGISPSDRERVFGRFEQAVGQGRRRGGFGVGLWVVRQLAEAMGGMVAIEDAPGGGALFTVTLPQHARGAPP